MAIVLKLKRKMLPEKRSSRDTIVFAMGARFVAMAGLSRFESRGSGFAIRLQKYSYGRLASMP
jgi:hypothetical protein